MTESLYRKYRPQTFADVVGQDPIERTLRNALAQNKVSHAYLFTGPRGTGKTTTARLMAKALLCERGITPDPDGACEACRMIADGAHPDVYELDAASRTGVENVREEIIGRVNFAPTIGRMKVYIIDEVHMLSTAAFNALLKTLEEPPGHVVFILCTTDPQKVPATIHSRCQRFDFHRISADEIVARLGAICVSEGVEFEPEALALIADRSDGGMRNALTTLEQLMVFCDGRVTLSGAEDLLGSLASSEMADIVSAIGRRDAAACFTWTARYVETGADLAQFVEDLAARMRALYVMSIAGDEAVLDLGESERTQMAAELGLFGPERLARMMSVIGDLLSELRTSRNPRLAFEIALTRMVHPASDLTLESLAERVEELERRLAAQPSGVPQQPVPPNVMPIPNVATPPRQAASPAPAAVVARSAGFRPAQPPQAPRPAAAPAPRSDAADETDLPIAPVVPAGSIAQVLSNPAALQRQWKAAIDQLKRVKTAYGVLFMNTTVAPSDQGDSIVVTFPAANSFAYGAVRKNEVYEELQKAVATAFGRPIAVSFTQEGSAAPASMPAPQPVAKPGPAPAPVPAPQPAPVPEPRPDAGPAVPQDRPAPRQVEVRDDSGEGYYDEVPVDVYGDIDEASYEEEPPFVAPSRGFQPGASKSPARNAAPAAEPQAPAFIPPTVRIPATTVPEDSGDIADILSAGFGDSVTFEEVDD